MVLRDLLKLNHPNSSPCTDFTETDYFREDYMEVAAVSDGSDELEKSVGLTEKDKGQCAFARSEKRPVGRSAAKEKAAAQHVRIEKLKLAEGALAVHEGHMKEIIRSNEMFLFTISFNGANLDLAGK